MHSSLNDMGGLDAIIQNSKIKLETTKKNINARYERANGLYVYGAGVIGKQILNECILSNIKIHGVLDSNPEKIGTYFCGMEILDPKIETDKNAVIVVAVGNNVIPLINELKDFGYTFPVTISEFFYAFEISSQPEKDYIDDLQKNLIRWEICKESFSDRLSIDVYNALIKYRLTLNVQYLSDVKSRDHEQWFDPQLVKRDPFAIFVDGGAFDGDTVKKFIEFNGVFKRIYAFEINPAIARKALSNLEYIHGLNVVPMGLSEVTAEVFISNTDVMHGKVLNETDNVDFKYKSRSCVTSIDSYVLDNITFMKLDVEGSEIKVLEGAKNHITNNRPIIAIAVYHKASDLHEIIKIISSMCSDYKFYLRHYTDCQFETVLYCIAK